MLVLYLCISIALISQIKCVTTPSPAAEDIFAKLKNIRVLQGDDATFVCTFNTSDVKSLEWSRYSVDKVLNTTWNAAVAGNLTSTVEDMSLKNVLIIKKSEYNDAGFYVCNVTTTSSSFDVDVFQLRVKDRLAALWPFIGIVIEVVVLVAVILVYEKKRANSKKAFEEGDAADNLIDGKEKDGAADGKNDDVRQRAVKA